MTQPLTCGVYRITGRTTGAYYVGGSTRLRIRFRQHLNLLRQGKHYNDGLQAIFAQYGEQNLEFAVVDFCDESSLLDREQTAISESDTRKLLNICPTSRCGNNLSNHPDKAGIVDRIRDTLRKTRAAMTSEERKALWSLPGSRNPMYGKTHTADARARISRSSKGNTYAKGAKRSVEQRAALSKRASTRTGSLNSFYGRTHSDKTCELLRLKMTGKKNANCYRKVFVEGKIYESLTEASRQLGISSPLLVYRLKSTKEKYKSYQYVN